jgi:hypothetical protein
MKSPRNHHEITMLESFVKQLFTAMVSPWILQRCSEESKCNAQLQQAAPAQTWWVAVTIGQSLWAFQRFHHMEDMGSIGKP